MEGSKKESLIMLTESADCGRYQRKTRRDSVDNEADTSNAMRGYSQNQRELIREIGGLPKRIMLQQKLKKEEGGKQMISNNKLTVTASCENNVMGEKE